MNLKRSLVTMVSIGAFILSPAGVSAQKRARAGLSEVIAVNTAAVLADASKSVEAAKVLANLKAKGFVEVNLSASAATAIQESFTSAISAAATNQPELVAIQKVLNEVATGLDIKANAVVTALEKQVDDAIAAAGPVDPSVAIGKKIAVEDDKINGATGVAKRAIQIDVDLTAAENLPPSGTKAAQATAIRAALNTSPNIAQEITDFNNACDAEVIVLDALEKERASARAAETDPAIQVKLDGQNVEIATLKTTVTDLKAFITGVTKFINSKSFNQRVMDLNTKADILDIDGSKNTAKDEAIARVNDLALLLYGENSGTLGQADVAKAAVAGSLLDYNSKLTTHVGLPVVDFTTFKPFIDALTAVTVTNRAELDVEIAKFEVAAKAAFGVIATFAKDVATQKIAELTTAVNLGVNTAAADGSDTTLWGVYNTKVEALTTAGNAGNTVDAIGDQKSVLNDAQTNLDNLTAASLKAITDVAAPVNTLPTALPVYATYAAWKSVTDALQLAITNFIAAATEQQILGGSDRAGVVTAIAAMTSSKPGAVVLTGASKRIVDILPEVAANVKVADPTIVIDWADQATTKTNLEAVGLDPADATEILAIVARARAGTAAAGDVTKFGADLGSFITNVGVFLDTTGL